MVLTGWVPAQQLWLLDASKLQCYAAHGACRSAYREVVLMTAIGDVHAIAKLCKVTCPLGHAVSNAVPAPMLPNKRLNLVWTKDGGLGCSQY